MLLEDGFIFCPIKSYDIPRIDFYINFFKKSIEIDYNLGFWSWKFIMAMNKFLTQEYSKSYFCTFVKGEREVRVWQLSLFMVCYC
jgi:hypothetical protein